MHTPTQIANTVVAFKIEQHSSCYSAMLNLLVPFITFCSVYLKKHFTITGTLFQMGLQPYLKLAGGVSFFFSSISQKEIKYTWPGMLLMFLPINLSTTSVGYWIQYTFLCSNKLFKFLNIKGSKRKKFNFHRRD